MISGFEKFLENIKNYDCQLLGRGELHKVPVNISAFSNSYGGWLILGAELDENNELKITGLPEDYTAPESYSTETFHVPERITALYIPSAEWNKKPLTYNSNIYRRVEGINLISGLWAKSIMASDALTPSRDDYPVENVSINEDCLNDFRRRVIALHDEYKCFSREEFMRRTGIYSGKYMTFAGALMFGNIIRVRVFLRYGSGIKIEADNIWRAYSDILPRLRSRLSGMCAGALREMFVNSLLHSDYNIDTKINVIITSGPPRVIIDNPGIIRGTTRNYRLKRIFALSGITSSDNLETIKKYYPSYTLKQDMLNFRVLSSIRLEGLKGLPEAVML